MKSNRSNYTSKYTAPERGCGAVGCISPILYTLFYAFCMWLALRAMDSIIFWLGGLDALEDWRNAALFLRILVVLFLSSVILPAWAILFVLSLIFATPFFG